MHIPFPPPPKVNPNLSGLGLLNSVDLCRGIQGTLNGQLLHVFSAPELLH